MNPTPTGSVSPPPLAGLLLASALAIGLLAISMARLAGDMGSTAFNLDLARSALSVPIWRSRLGLNLGLFVLALAALHLAFGLLCWLLARLSEYAAPKVRCKRRDWILIWYVAGVAWLLIANASWFPKSSLGEPYQGIVRANLLGLDLLGLVTIALLTGIAAVTLLALRRTLMRKVALAITGIAAVAVAAGFSVELVRPAHTDSERPHIIVLGIDSLRPDAIDAAVTPHLNAFMEGAVQLTDAMTPLARTFPSWVSILTGRHPHTTGAYMNLLPRELIRTGTTLPQILREHGYRTWYAIDETRFSNLDVSYGFDQAVTPVMGGSDFMLSRLADTPLSNLIVNTRLGALLFPHVHTNRGASVVYDPDSFVRRIGREVSFGCPAFLAIHLTLPHWPFTWATSDTDALQNTAEELYRESIRRADQQFGDLLALLKRRGALDNALVIALSDHGEALGRPEEFMSEAFPAGTSEATEYQRWGHGTSVFSPQQYRVVLGFRSYGAASPDLGAKGLRNAPVSLVDIAPTVLDLLNINSKESFDGVSLAAILLSGEDAESDFKSRIRFTESEYNPQGFDPRKFSTSQLAAAAQIYRLDPGTDRISIRTDVLDEIMSTRQYAAFVGNRAMGAAIPGPKSDGKYEFLYATLPGGSAPDDDLDRQLLASALAERFRIELTAAP